MPSTYVCAMFSKHVGDEIIFIAYATGKLDLQFLIIGLIVHEIPFRLIKFEEIYNYRILIITLMFYIYIIGINNIKKAYLTPMEYFELNKILNRINEV